MAEHKPPQQEKVRLQRRINNQVARLKQAEQDRRTLLAQTTYVGMLGLLLVLPVIAGAYLGRWLDSMMKGYSLRWTLSMIFLGLVVGCINVYLLVRRP